MARKRYQREEIVSLLRQAEVLHGQGMSMADAIRQLGISEVTFYSMDGSPVARDVDLSGVAGLTTAKHGPDDPCVLAGDGNRGPVEATPLVKPVAPCVEGVRLSCRRADHGSGALHEEGSQVLAAALGDTEHHGALTARVLARDEPDPGGKVTSVLELDAAGDGGDDGGGGLRPHSLDPGDPLAVLGCTEDAFDLLVEARGPAIEVPEQVVEFADRLASQGGQLVLLIGEDLRGHPARAGDALGEGDAAIEQETPYLADHSGAVVDHALPSPMQDLNVPQTSSSTFPWSWCLASFSTAAS